MSTLSLLPEALPEALALPAPAALAAPHSCELRQPLS